jgi:putative oxidoreductase
MTMPANDALGKLLLRLTIAFLMLPHGIAKVTGGVDGIAGMLAAVGVPGFVAYGVWIGELVAPAMLIAGYYARVGAAIIVINMIVAIALVHSSQLLDFTELGGFRLDSQYFYLFTSLAAMLLGPGRYAVNDK